MPARLTLSAVEQTRVASLSDRFRPIAEQIIETADERCRDQSCEILLVYGHRSMDEQLELWSRGRRMLDPSGRAWDPKNWQVVGDVVTHAMPGSSPHNWGEAIDLALVDPSAGRKWLPAADHRWHLIVGVAALGAGMVWGGKWKMRDMAHIEHPLWVKLRDEWKTNHANR